MMMPSIFGENLFDDFMNDFRLPAFPDVDKELYGKHAKNLMKTDVKETEGSFELDIDMPGYKKEDVKAELKDGYLTISATSDSKKEEKNDKGQYIRRERYTGSCSRSFYVGEDVQQEDIKAEFKHGILKLFVPKKEAKPAVEEKKHIAIEG